MNIQLTSEWWFYSNLFGRLVCNYYHTCRQNSCFTSKNLFESSIVVLASTWCQSGILTLVSDSKSTASNTSTGDNTTTIQYNPVTSLAGSNNALAHYKQWCAYGQILSNIHCLYWCSCNLLTSYLYTVWTWVSCRAIRLTKFLRPIPKCGEDQWDCKIINYYVLLPLQQ